MQMMQRTCIPTDIFMTDMASAFYNAWSQVFSHPEMRLVCSWHVHRAWTKKKCHHTRCNEDRDRVYQYLKIVEGETNRGKFTQLLGNLLSYLHNKHKDFFDYFLRLLQGACSM